MRDNSPHPTTPGAPRSRSWLDAFFGIDLRSLAVLRVGIALALLHDWIDRAGDLVAHYTDAGVLPASVFLPIVGKGFYFTPFYHLSGNTWAVAGLFALALLSAIALLLGYRTRAAALLAWALLVAIQLRTPFLSWMGGDKFLRSILFWALFLPLGARWSLDARRDPELRSGPDRVLSIPSAALVLQVCLMYWATGLLKCGPTWLRGNAVFYALHMDHLVTPLGMWLREMGALLPTLTHSVRWFEMLGPFLVFSPVHTAAFRMFAIAAFAILHLSLAVTLDIGPFPLYSIVAWPAFLPSAFWDQWLPRITGRSAPGRSRAPGPAPRALRTPRPLQALVGCVLLYTFSYSAIDVAQTRFHARVSMPPLLLEAGRFARMNISWRMFAPEVPREQLWPAFRGVLVDGRQVDPLRGRMLFEPKPQPMRTSFPSFRWKLLLYKAMGDTRVTTESQLLFENMSRYLCETWNAEHQGAERLAEIYVEYWRAPVSLVDGIGSLSHRRVLHYSCSEGPL